MKRRVVITGVGAVSPIGIGKEEFVKSLKEGKSGVGKITRFENEDLQVKIAAEVKDFNVENYLSKREAKRMDLYSQYGVAASQMALEDAKIDLDNIDKERFGVIIGSGIGGIGTFEEQSNIFKDRGAKRISPFFIPMMITNMAAGNIAIKFKAKGPNETIVTACASSTHAIGDAFEIIKRGDGDIIITGGTEASITEMSVSGFASMKALSTRNDQPEKASRPFDKDRDGFVMGEGAGILILEELEHAKKRNAKIYAEVLGYGLSCDANHITTPAENGEGARRSMEMAIKKAGLKPEDIDYINAHGTSTYYNDLYETMAIKDLFKNSIDKIKVSSIKSMTGHLLGAAGGIEACACAVAIDEEFLPPTINYENKDEECDLDYVPNKAENIKIDYALSNSLGFGGQNASIILGRYKE
ncbi:MAG: beta-ketoacyl-ACP synthase II [Andreesenia angusta]|nr:beta-ketoacyl-ACP synthase II [Andreesenia angusta]